MRKRVVLLVLPALAATAVVASRCQPEPAPPAVAAPPAEPATQPFTPPASAPLARLAAPPADADPELDVVAAANGTGTLVVQATHARNGALAIGVNLRLDDPSTMLPQPGNQEARGSLLRTTTVGQPAAARCVARARVDGAGVAHFLAVPAGDYLLRNDRLDPDRPITVHAGRTHRIDYQVQPGMRIQGVVTDARGQPIGGAAIELLAGTAPLEQVTTTDHAGRFEVLDVHISCTLVARAEGHRAAAHDVKGLRDPRDVRLTLAADGAAVWGSVEDEHGQLLADAVVQIGEEPHAGSRRLIVRTDQRGAFRVLGLDPGEHGFRAHAPAGSAAGTCSTGGFLRIVLRPARPTDDRAGTPSSADLLSPQDAPSRSR